MNRFHPMFTSDLRLQMTPIMIYSVFVSFFVFFFLWLSLKNNEKEKKTRFNAMFPFFRQRLKCQVSPCTGFPAAAKCRVLFLPYFSFNAQGYNSAAARCRVGASQPASQPRVDVLIRPRVGGENGLPAPLTVTGFSAIRCE